MLSDCSFFDLKEVPLFILEGPSFSSNLGLLDIFRGEIFGEPCGDNLPELEDRFGFTFADIFNPYTVLGRHSEISVSQAVFGYLIVRLEAGLDPNLILFTMLT